MAAASRARHAKLSAKALSSWLEADKRSVQLGLAEESAVARRDRLEESIAELEAEMQPIPASALASMTPQSGAPVGAEAVSIVERYLGVPYRWGGSSPAEGFDCSGLTMYVYAQLGIQLPHYAAAQWSEGVQIDPSLLEPGDLVFFESGPDGPGHVAIYVGADQIVEAPHSGDVVKLASFSGTAGALGFVGAVRPADALASLFP
jgi:cell wall-associated NlpC family hydrolase